MITGNRVPAGDQGVRVTLAGRIAPLRFICHSAVAALVIVTLWSAPILAGPVRPTWVQYSDSYEVHLGVVSARKADADDTLIRMHATVPHGQTQRTEASRHIMVTVFKRPAKERVRAADVTAEVIESDFIHTRREQKHLDPMVLPGGASFCNFFTLHWNGTYRIDVRIARPGTSPEWVTFYQEETELSN